MEKAEMQKRKICHLHRFLAYLAPLASKSTARENRFWQGAAACSKFQ